jgi:hypothetical protein
MAELIGYSSTLPNPTRAENTGSGEHDDGISTRSRFTAYSAQGAAAGFGRRAAKSQWPGELMQIAAVQQAISAFEDVIADLDAEMEAAA